MDTYTTYFKIDRTTEVEYTIVNEYIDEITQETIPAKYLVISK